MIRSNLNKSKYKYGRFSSKFQNTRYQSFISNNSRRFGDGTKWFKHIKKNTFMKKEMFGG